MRRIEMEFKGPFCWGGDTRVPNIYGKAYNAVTTKGGVYLWTVLTPDGDELVFYVGQTGNFRERFKEHQGEQSSGWYHVYDPDTFAVGQKDLLWHGVYGHKTEIDARFTSRFEMIRPFVARFMASLRFHLAPISAEQAEGMEKTEFRKRFEAGMAHHFRHQEGVVGRFQDEGVYYLERCTLPRVMLRNLNWPPPDASTEIICRANVKIRSFPDRIIV